MGLSKNRKYIVFFSAMIFRVVSIGSGYGFSVMYAEIVRVFSVSRFKASLIQGIYEGLATGAGLLWCDVIQKFGTGIPSAVGFTVAAASLFACAFVRQIEVIIVLAGAISGLGMSISYLSSFISVSIAFKEDPRVPLTCVSTGTSIGAFLLPLLYELFIANFFWSGAFMLIAGLILQCIPCGILIHFMLKEDENRNLKEPATRPNICKRGLLQDYVLWIILIDGHLFYLTGNFEAWFIVDQLVDIGYAREKGSILVSVIGLGNLCGRILGSILKFKCKEIPAIFHWLYLCPIAAAAHALVLYLQHVYPLLVLACFLQGTTYGVTSSQIATIVYEHTGSENYPAAVALLLFFLGAAHMISLMFGGTIHDALGSYDAIYYCAIGVTVLVTAGSLIVSYHARKKYRKLNDELVSTKSPLTNYSTLKTK